VLALDRPEGDGLRIDDALAPGLTVDTAYDSLLAKLIAHGETREVALGRLRGGLSRLSILGIPTTTAYLRGLLADEAVVAGRLDTQLVTRRGAPDGPIDDRGVAIAAAMLMLAEEASAHAGGDPFARVDGWRLGGDRAGSHWRLAVNGGAALDVQVPPAYAQLVTAFGKGRFAIDGRGEWRLARDGDVVWIGHGGWSWAVREAAATADAETTGDGEVRAPMPGQVLSVHGAVGDVIAAGTSLIVLESMKMELVLTAPIDGRIATLNVAPGERVALDQPLARLQAHE